MPRIRTIKPEFWEDDVVGSLSREARLLFIASWNLADDEGLLRWSAAYLKASAFMFDDDIDVSATEKLMAELVSAELVHVYRAGKAHQQFGHILGFRKHQKINRPSPSKLPPPSSAMSDSLSDSLTEREREREREREKKEGGDSPSPNGDGRPPRWSVKDTEEALAIWNEELGGRLPKVIKLTESRRQALRGRLTDLETLENWRLYCRRIRDTPFLVGENGRQWRADFDWSIKLCNMAKVLEGNYDK